MIKYLSEAYKPEEKLIFNYMLIKSALNSILREQKYPADIELSLTEVYKNFEVNSEKLLNLYMKLEDVLPIDKLFSELREEKDVLLANSGLDQPLLPEQDAIKNLAKFIIEMNLVYLKDSEGIEDAVPNFHWDVESFENYFDEIKERCKQYATNE